MTKEQRISKDTKKEYKRCNMLQTIILPYNSYKCRTFETARAPGDVTVHYLESSKSSLAPNAVYVALQNMSLV